jgi:hypothetical protein
MHMREAGRGGVGTRQHHAHHAHHSQPRVGWPVGTRPGGLRPISRAGRGWFAVCFLAVVTIPNPAISPPEPDQHAVTRAGVGGRQRHCGLCIWASPTISGPLQPHSSSFPVFPIFHRSPTCPMPVAPSRLLAGHKPAQNPNDAGKCHCWKKARADLHQKR